MSASLDGHGLSRASISKPSSRSKTWTLWATSLLPGRSRTRPWPAVPALWTGSADGLPHTGGVRPESAQRSTCKVSYWFDSLAGETKMLVPRRQCRWGEPCFCRPAGTRDPTRRVPPTPGWSACFFAGGFSAPSSLLRKQHEMGARKRELPAYLIHYVYLTGVAARRKRRKRKLDLQGQDRAPARCQLCGTNR